MNFTISRILRQKLGLSTLVLFIATIEVAGQENRPMIWVKNSDKQVILKNIQDHPEIKNHYTGFKNRVDLEMKGFQQDKFSYLSKLPLKWDKQLENNMPPFETFFEFRGAFVKRIDLLRKYNQTAIDAGILYFLTGDEKYADYASTILYTVVEAIGQLTPSDKKKMEDGCIQMII